MAAIMQSESSAICWAPSDNKLTITFPNLFISFLAEEPSLNPHYEKVRPIAEENLSKQVPLASCQFDGATAASAHKLDFSRFCAIALPDADESGLQLLCEWGTWGFFYDDQFDRGHLKGDEKAARQMTRSLLSALVPYEDRVDESEKCRMVKFNDSIWARLQREAPAGLQRRFVNAIVEWSQGTMLSAMAVCEVGKELLERILQERRSSVGVRPVLALMEHALKFDLPDKVPEHAAVREMEDLAIDLIVMQNDMFSYRKEQTEDTPHNVVVAAMLHPDNFASANPIQTAFDFIATEHNRRVARMSALLADLPTFDTRTTPDAHRMNTSARRYVQAILDVVRANFYWSISTPRYLGKDRESWRKTGRLEVMRYPAFLLDAGHVGAVEAGGKMGMGRPRRGSNF